MAYLTATQARKVLHCSKAKMAQMIREGTLPTHADPLNKRRKLIDEADVKKLQMPRVVFSFGYEVPGLPSSPYAIPKDFVFPDVTDNTTGGSN